MDLVTSTLTETLITELAEWIATKPVESPDQWLERFFAHSVDSAQQAVVRDALAADNDVAVYPLWFQVKPTGDGRGAVVVAPDGSLHVDAPYRYRRGDYGQDLVVLLTVGHTEAPGALIVHWSSIEGFEECFYSTDTAVVLPGNPWIDVPAPALVPLWCIDDMRLAPEINTRARNQALGSLLNACDVSVRVSYRGLGVVCPDCWDTSYSRLTDHPQLHHDRLGMCVDSGAFPVIDAALENGWRTRFSCQGYDEALGGWPGYVMLLGTMSAETQAALLAAGCVVEPEPEAGRVTVRWPVGEPERVVQALNAGPTPVSATRATAAAP